MEEADTYARILWDYMKLGQELFKADAIIALGTNDLRVADCAAELWHAKWAPYIICTGGIAHKGDINETGWTVSEAEMYEDRLIELGVAPSAIVLEKEAKNLGDNATLVKKLLQEKGLDWKTFIVVSKPWIERRARAAFKKRWPEATTAFASVRLSYDEYMETGKVSKDVFINVLVGDLERLRLYAEEEFVAYKEYFAENEWNAISKSNGYQAKEVIPDEVWNAYKKLVSLGYNKYTLEYLKLSRT